MIIYVITAKADEKIYTKIEGFVSENYMETGEIRLYMTREEIKEDEEGDFIESD